MYALYFLVMIFIIKCRKYSTFISSLRKCSFNETQCFQNETSFPRSFMKHEIVSYFKLTSPHPDITSQFNTVFIFLKFLFFKINFITCS